MAVARALGLASGARGIDHVREVFAVQRDSRVLLAVGLKTRLAQHQGFQAMRNRQLAEQRRLGQQQLHAAVVEHVGQAFAWVVGVQRHIGAAGLEHRKQADNHVEGALHRQPHTHIRTDTGLDQAMGQAVGAAVELGVVDTLLGKHQGRGLRLAFGLGFDQVMHPLVLRVVAGGGVPLLKYLLALGHVQHGQVLQGPRRVGHRPTQQAQPVPEHARGGAGIEQVRGVSQRRPEAVLGLLGVQAQVELRGAGLMFQADHPQARQLLYGRPHLRLMVEHHLEQRVMAKTALRLQGLHQLLEG